MCFRLIPSLITPEMVCSCDMNKKLTARTNAFSKVLDSDWISVPDSSNSSNRYLCVVLCESMIAKVAHVFEMEKSSGMSSSLTLEVNLVCSFEIATSECDKIALSRTGKAIVTYNSKSWRNEFEKDERGVSLWRAFS